MIHVSCEVLLFYNWLAGVLFWGNQYSSGRSAVAERLATTFQPGSVISQSISARMIHSRTAEAMQAAEPFSCFSKVIEERSSPCGT